MEGDLFRFAYPTSANEFVRRMPVQHATGPRGNWGVFAPRARRRARRTRASGVPGRLDRPAGTRLGARCGLDGVPDEELDEVWTTVAHSTTCRPAILGPGKDVLTKRSRFSCRAPSVTKVPRRRWRSTNPACASSVSTRCAVTRPIEYCCWSSASITTHQRERSGALRAGSITQTAQSVHDQGAFERSSNCRFPGRFTPGSPSRPSRPMLLCGPAHCRSIAGISVAE